MAIQVENPESRPQLDYNKVFMDHLEILQERVPMDDDNPKYILRVRFRLYAVDSDKKRHYSARTRICDITDYHTVAKMKAMAGNFDLANAHGAIKKALVSILIDQQPDLGLVQEV